ncbi:MAG: hypothetical protein Q9221_008363 [Calogaya cf. arnoldii]
MRLTQGNVAWVTMMCFSLVRRKLSRVYTALYNDPKILIRGTLRSREEPKVAIPTRRSAALLQSTLVACRLALTFGILQLSWRRVYWKDLDDSSSAQNSILTTIQFVAKFHEICIVGSLPSIGLHLIQSEMLDEGVPFGLMTSAYKVSSITYLWSWEFWGGIFERDLRQSYLRRIRLHGNYSHLMSGSCFGTLVCYNIASEVGLVACFDSSSSDYLPSQECLLGRGYDQKYCPCAGRSKFDPWGPGALATDRNLTRPISDSARARYLAASAPAQDSTKGYTQASTMHDITAKPLSGMWTIVNEGWAALPPVLLLKYPVSSKRPIIHAATFDKTPSFKPFVAVQCRAYNATQQDIEFPHDHRASNTMNHSWTVSEDFRKAWPDALNKITFAWSDLSSNIDPPAIAAISKVTLPPPRSSDGRSMPAGSHRAIVTCTIDAWWVPVRIWVDPRGDNSIHEDSADIVKSDIFTHPQKLMGQ